MAAAALSRRHKAFSVSAAASADHFQLDKDGIPNEGVLQAIEALGYTCAVHDVVAHCGLPRDLVEAEMMALLRASSGFFEITSASANDEIMKYQQQKHHHHHQHQHKEVEFAANVFSTDHIRYVFPPGLRSFLRRRFVLIRMREAGAKVWGMAFAFLRVSIGVLLLLSLLVIVIVLVIVVARSSGGEHRHDSGLDALRVFHRPRRHYVGGGGLGGAGNDWRDMYYMWWWWNYNPFLFGLDPQLQAQRLREQQARRRRALDALDEEEGGMPEVRGGGGGGGRDGRVSAGTRRIAGSSSFSSSYRLAGHEEQDGGEQQQERGEEEAEEVEEDMTFLEALFSLLFGDGSPGPSQNQRWQAVAKLIHAQNGIVLPEEVAPLLTDVDPEKLDTSMLPVCARFGGRPVRCVDGKMGRNWYLIERRYVFSRAPLHLLQLSGALGLINLVGAIWASEQWVQFTEPASTVLYVVGKALLCYAALYLLLPLTRLVIISIWNRGIVRRNAVRKGLWREWKQAQMGEQGEGEGRGGREGVLYAKMEYAYKCRMEVG
ncbi:Hypothetical protein NocV09_00300680 [Nannochloropsis oceanica]